MSSISSISLSGMNAAQTVLPASDFNLASFGTNGFRRQQVEQISVAPAGVSTTLGKPPMSDDAMVTDMVDMLQAKNAFLAKLTLLKTSAKMAGTPLGAIG